MNLDMVMGQPRCGTPGGVVRPLFERFFAKNGVALFASPVLYGGWCLQDGITDTRTPAKFDFKVRPGRVAT